MLPTTPSLTDTLLKLQPQEVLSAERQVDLPAIVRSSEPSLYKLSLDNHTALLAFATMCVRQYLEHCFPAQTGIATMFASDLITTRPTWKAADFINIFRFFRQRQDLDGLKVFGNTITHSKLMEMVTIYELERAKEKERYEDEKKGLYLQPAPRRYSDSSVKSELGRIAEATAAKQEEKRAKGWLREEKVAPDEAFFKREFGVG